MSTKSELEIGYPDQTAINIKSSLSKQEVDNAISNAAKAGGIVRVETVDSVIFLNLGFCRFVVVKEHSNVVKPALVDLNNRKIN